MQSDGQRIITWNDFGPWLSRLRRRRGLSQERLAALLGCNRITTWRLENGTHPSILVLRDIERAVRLTAREVRWLGAFVELRETHVEKCHLAGDAV